MHAAAALAAAAARRTVARAPAAALGLVLCALLLPLLLRRSVPPPPPPPRSLAFPRIARQFDRVLVVSHPEHAARWTAFRRRLALGSGGSGDGEAALPENAVERFADGVVAWWRDAERVRAHLRHVCADNRDRDHDDGGEASRCALRAPEAAISLSYLQLLRHAQLAGYERLLVLEDDVCLHRNFSAEFAARAAHIEDGWLLALAGASQHGWGDAWLRAHAGTALLYHPLRTTGAFAVAYRRPVFELLAYWIERSARAYDRGPLQRVMQQWHALCYVMYPNVAVADVATSSVRAGRDARDAFRRFRWDAAAFSPECGGSEGAGTRPPSVESSR